MKVETLFSHLEKFELPKQAKVKQILMLDLIKVHDIQVVLFEADVWSWQLKESSRSKTYKQK